VRDAHERHVARLRSERRLIQDKYESWDDDTDAAYGYLHAALFPEAQRLADRSDGLLEAIAALAEQYKLKNTHQLLFFLLEF